MSHAGGLPGHRRQRRQHRQRVGGDPGAVTIDGGAGADVLTGDSGNTIFAFTATALTATDKVTGNGHNNELEVTTAGTS